MIKHHLLIQGIRVRTFVSKDAITHFEQQQIVGRLVPNLDTPQQALNQVSKHVFCFDHLKRLKGMQ